MQGSINFDGSLVGNITGGGGGGGDTVVITPVITSGTKIADVSVNGVEKDLYCPTPTAVSVTQVQQSGTKIATIGVNGVNTDIYTPEGGGSDVEITPVVTSGTKIADVSVGGVEKNLYTPDYGADITEIKQSLSDLENVIEEIDGITIYKQILNQTIASFSAKSSMSIMKLVANISNVNGCTEANVTVCGTNIWDEEWEVGDINSTTGENEPSSSNIRSKNYIQVKPNTSYYFCSPNQIKIRYYDRNKRCISAGVIPNNNVITMSEQTYYIRFSMPNAYGTTYNNDISINYPSTDTSYHTYNGDTYNIPFVDGGGNTLTIYNGSVDLINGILIDDDNTTNYQISANPINDLQGNNNIWSDTGSIASVGYLDILNIS